MMHGHMVWQTGTIQHGMETARKVQELLYLNPADGYGWKHVDKSMP